MTVNPINEGDAILLGSGEGLAICVVGRIHNIPYRLKLIINRTPLTLNIELQSTTKVDCFFYCFLPKSRIVFKKIEISFEDLDICLVKGIFEIHLDVAFDHGGAEHLVQTFRRTPRIFLHKMIRILFKLLLREFITTFELV